MDILAHQVNSCTGNKQWYVCTAGNFRGCCSSDPCTTGICPDDDDSTFTETTSTSSAIPSRSSSIPKTSTTITNSSTSTEETTSIDGATSTASSSSATATPVPTPTKSSPNGAIIGGVVGGVVALIVLALLLFFCWRRKRREKNNLHRSLSSRSLHIDAVGSPRTADASPTEREPLRLNDSSTGLPNMAHSTTGSNTNVNISEPSSITTSTLNLTGISTTSSLSTTNPAAGVETSTTRDLPRLPPVVIPSSEHLASAPSSTGIRSPQELPDTGFYRQRAELASHNQSELINIPYRERRRKGQQRHRTNKPTSRSWESSPASPTSSIASPSGRSPRLMDRKTARRVVTRDGIVLNANLDLETDSPVGESAVTEKENKRRSGDHVMSFMTYGENSDRTRMGSSSDLASGRYYVMAGVAEENQGPENEVLPAYDVGEGDGSVDRDAKSPLGTLGEGVRTD
ncbi:hypothetical protein N7512_007239 [Penicillium capsulatum]|nr:hypothetical protein N7512_007239 [Penicillium capsulatum]